MENTEEEALPAEATGEPEYNTYQLVWIQPDGTGVRQTVFEKSYAGAPSVYASHRQGNKHLREGSTGSNDSYLETPSVDNVSKATPGGDGNREHRHHLKRQHSETCTSCGALYLDTSVSVDSESDVSDSDSTHGRSVIIRQFSTDSRTDAMTIVEPSPQNRSKLYRGESVSRSASEDWVLQHVPHIAGTHITQRHGSGVQSNTGNIQPGPIPLNRETCTKTRLSTGPAEVTLSMDRGIDDTLQYENVYIPHGTSVVNKSTVIDGGLPRNAGFSKEGRIDGPEQVTITRHVQDFPERDPVYGQHYLRNPLSRHRSLEKQIPHKIFRTGSLHVADGEPVESRLFSVDNVTRDGGDIPDDGNMTLNRTEPLSHETQDRYPDGIIPGRDGIIQEESVLAFSPERKAPNIISEKVLESNVGRPVREYHDTRFIEGSMPNPNQTSPYRYSQLHGSDNVVLTGVDTSYRAELEGDEQTSRPGDRTFTETTTSQVDTWKQGRGIQKPALTTEGPTDPVITKTLHRQPLESEVRHIEIRTSNEADGGYRQLPGGVSEATIKDTRPSHDAVSGYRQLPGEVSEATIKDTRPSHDAVSGYRQLPGEVSEATIKDTRPSHDAVSGYRQLPGEVSEATIKDTRPSQDAVSGYRQLPGEVSEATIKDTRPSHNAVSGYRQLPGEVSEATIKDTRPSHDAVSGYRQLPGEVSEATIKDTRPSHNAVSGYRQLPGEVSEATIKDTRPSHDAVSGYRQLPGEVSEATIKDTRPSHNAVSGYRQLPGEVSEATIKDTRPSHDAMSGYRQLPEEVSEATIKDTRPSHDAVSGYRQLPGEVSEATIKDTRPSHDAVSGYRQLPGEVSEATIKDTRPSHDAVSGYRQLPGEVSEATIKDTRPSHNAVSGYRQLPGEVSEATIKDTRPSHDAVSGYRQLPGEVSEATIKDTRPSHDAVSGYRQLPGEVSEATIKDTRPSHDAVSGYRQLPEEVSEATIKDTRPSHNAVSGYRQLPGEVSEATIKDTRPSHDAVSEYRQLLGEVSEATIKDTKLSHDAVSGYRQLPGEVSEATIKDTRPSHNAVSGYRQLPGEVSEATIKDTRPSHDAVSEYRQLLGEVSEATIKDTKLSHDAVSGYRQLPGEVNEVTIKDTKVTAQQQGPEKLSTQILKQITRPTDQAYRFKSPSVDLPSGHSYLQANEKSQDDPVLDSDELVHGPSIERSPDTDGQLDAIHAVTALRNLESIAPVRVLSDQPDQPVTDGRPGHDSKNEDINVQGENQVTLDPVNQEQPEQQAIKGHKYIHGPNLEPRENQHQQQRIEELAVGKKIDHSKTPGVDADRQLDAENIQDQTDTLTIPNASGPDQGPEDQPASVDRPQRDNQFQGQTQSIIHPGRQEQLNKVRETRGPGDPQWVVAGPDDDLLAEYMQLPENSQASVIQADRGQRFGRVASLDRHQTQGQRRVPFRDNGLVLKSKESPASIVSIEDNYPRTLLKEDDRVLNQHLYTGDGNCTSTDITYKSIATDVSHRQLPATKECPVISSTIALSTNYSLSPAGEQVYIEETPSARRQQQCRSNSNIIINNDLSTNETYSPVSEGIIQLSKVNRYQEISFGRLPSDLPASLTEMSLLFIDHKETFLDSGQRAFISGGRNNFGAIPIIVIDEAITVADKSVAQPVPVEEESVQQESKSYLHSPLNVVDTPLDTEDKDNDIHSSEWSSKTTSEPAVDRTETQGCKDGGQAIHDEISLQSPLIGRTNSPPYAQVVDEDAQTSEWSSQTASMPATESQGGNDGGVSIYDELSLQSPMTCRTNTPTYAQVVDEDAQSSEWSSQTASLPATESQGGNDGGVSIYDELSLQSSLTCRTNTPPYAQVVDEDAQSSEWCNTRASAPSHVHSEHADDLAMPVYAETSLQIQTRNNTDGVDTSLSTSEWSNPTTSDQPAAHLKLQRDEDGGMPIYPETSLQIKTRRNTDGVDTSVPNSEWSSQTSVAPSARHVDSRPLGDGGMPMYGETSLCISKPNDDVRKTSPSSEWSNRTVSDPSAGSMVSPHYGASRLWPNDGPEQKQIVFDSPSDRTGGNTQDMIIPVHTRVLQSRRPYHWHRMPVDMRQGDGSLPCHVCQSLLPLLDRINSQLRDLEAQEPTPYEEEGLRNDMDRVFESLYAAIDQREEQLLASVDDNSPQSGKGDVDLGSLLAHLENTKSYCDKTLVYTTKPELLSLTGMIHTRADELLSQEIADPAPPSNVMFRDDGLTDLVEEIEKFGKVFNEKDVDAAVKEKTFPKEHKLSENDIFLEQRRSSLQSMPPVRRASMPPDNTGRDYNSMPHNGMSDRNAQPGSDVPGRGSRDVGYNGYPVGNGSGGFPPHGPYSRDGQSGPDRRSQEVYPYQRNDPTQSPDDRRQRANAYDPRTGDTSPIYQTPVDRRHEPAERQYDPQSGHADPLYRNPDDGMYDARGNPHDPQSRHADPLYRNPDDGRYDARGNPHDPQARDTGNDSSETYPQGQTPHSGYSNEGNQPVGRPLNRDEIIPDQASQQRSAANQYGAAPGQDLTADQPAPNEADTFPGSSALAVYLHAHQQKLRENDGGPATKDAMIFSITPEPDSDRDAILSVSPGLFQHEYLIKCVYMEFDKGTVYEDNHVTQDGKLVNDPPYLPSSSMSWRFKNYKGALSTRPLDGTGMSYLEFWTDIEIKQVHGGRSLIFEAAVADRDVIDLHHKAEDQIHAWGVSLSKCPEHDGLCRRTWGAGQELSHYPHTLPNQPDSKARLRFGFLIMQKQKKLVVIDCNEEKVLLTADNIKISRPLWPVFGVYNTDLSHVETSFVSGTNLKMDRNIAWLILQNM